MNTITVTGRIANTTQGTVRFKAPERLAVDTDHGIDQYVNYCVTAQVGTDGRFTAELIPSDTAYRPIASEALGGPVSKRYGWHYSVSYDLDGHPYGRTAFPIRVTSETPSPVDIGSLIGHGSFQ
ncbi:hypothetical protein [Streptomyces formicae]